VSSGIITKSGGMKFGVSVHCAQQLEWRHVLRHAR